jgi:hypothetical protein
LGCDVTLTETPNRWWRMTVDPGLAHEHRAIDHDRLL